MSNNPPKNNLSFQVDNLIENIKSSFNEKTATVIFLFGNLGAGKTTFVQNIAKKLGIKENVLSPTFVICKQYPLSFMHFITLTHIDLYRLESEEETKTINLENIIKDKQNLVFIEWPEKISNTIVSDFNISISFDTNKERSFILEKV